MQTFLPFASYRESAEALDDRRLGKQRVEAMQMVRAIMDPTYGWQNHPAVTMWRGHGLALIVYGMTVSKVWQERGFNDTCHDKLRDVYPLMRALGERVTKPKWMGDEAFHLSHQSNLIRKDPEHYASLFPDCPRDDIEYVWPPGVARSNDTGASPMKHPLLCPGCSGIKRGFTNRGDQINPWWCCSVCGKPTSQWFGASVNDMLNLFRNGPLDGMVYEALTILNDARLLPFLTSYEWTPEVVTGSTGRVARVWLHSDHNRATVDSTPSQVGTVPTTPQNRSKTMAKDETKTAEAAEPKAEKVPANTAGLEDLRKELKLSRAQLATASGLTVAQVYRIEKGGARTTQAEADLLRNALKEHEANQPAEAPAAEATEGASTPQ